MQHDIHREGQVFALRPVRRTDAAFIVRLRSDPERARFLHPIEPSVAAQEAFLEAYFERAGDYYFVVEARATCRPEGLIGIYHVDAAARTAEIGRWIVAPGSVAAIESILLLYRVAFEVLGLREVFCRTIVDNKRAVSFHDSCGLERRALRPHDVQLGEQTYDQVEHVLTLARWPVVCAKLSRLAQCVA